MICELYLPFPPTVNNYYSKGKGGGRYISLKGQKFREEVQKAVIEQAPGIVEVVLFAPDIRSRDVDNYNKALLDALTHAELWEDDKQVDQLFNYRGVVRSRQGQCYVRVTEAGPLISDVSQLSIE